MFFELLTRLWASCKAYVFAVGLRLPKARGEEDFGFKAKERPKRPLPFALFAKGASSPSKNTTTTPNMRTKNFEYILKSYIFMI